MLILSALCRDHPTWKKPFAAWFPYATVERLWYQLEELINLGHMVDQNSMVSILRGALQNHLKQVINISFFLLNK
ncbi:hypothetical protein BDE02_03G138000 [Populus trichocarpa]|nr:hypothetical protein BDE02_03G138000 [Populus trichocarpa]